MSININTNTYITTSTSSSISNSSQLFNKGKNAKINQVASKLSESHLYSKQNNNQPKKIDYTKITEPSSNLRSENIILNAGERTFYCINSDELFSSKQGSSEKHEKYNSPKNSKKTISVSSNLPTANNSFHTVMSSPDQVAYEDYQGLSATSNPNHHYDSLESVGSPNSSFCANPTPRNKKSDDFKVKFKTEKCKFWEIDRSCKYGDNCAFAHGTTDLRKKSSVTNSYRTRKCKQFFDNGFCPYGNRCQFAHALNNCLNNENSYKKSLKSINLISHPEELDLIKQNFHRPRLQAFQKICKTAKSKINCNSSKNYNNKSISSSAHNSTQNLSSFIDDIKKFYMENSDKMCQ